MRTELNIVLLDKHQLFREGVKQVLEAEPTFQIIVSSDDYSALQSALEAYPIDIILLDVNMFAHHKKDIAQLMKEFDAKIIVISNKDEKNLVIEAIEVGVHGYLLKDMDIYSFVDAIKLVKTGVFYLHPSASDELVRQYRTLVQKETKVMTPRHLFTKRECEILQLLTDGESNRQMAETLGISEKTVKNHVSSLFKKMNVNDRTKAVVTAIHNHWVKLDQS